MDGEGAARVRARVGAAPDRHGAGHARQPVAKDDRQHHGDGGLPRQSNVRTIRGDFRRVQAAEVPPVVTPSLSSSRVKNRCAASWGFRGGDPPRRHAVRQQPKPICMPRCSRWAWPSSPPATVIRQAAHESARWRWASNKRDQLVAHAPSPGAGPPRNLRASAPKGPVVLMDVGDDIGGGSPAGV